MCLFKEDKKNDNACFFPPKAFRLQKKNFLQDFLYFFFIYLENLFKP